MTRVNRTTPSGVPDLSYESFLASKTLVVQPSGIDVPADAVHPSLKGHQRDLTLWALRKGRAALFADAGLGKTRCYVEWARLICERVGGRALILAPLAVCAETIREAAQIGVTITYARSQADAAVTGLTITNYERLALFDFRAFTAVVADESSILKDKSSKTRAALIEACRNVPHRLAATATPAPNDHAELANHAEWLGVMSRGEVLATFFVHANKQNPDGTKAKTSEGQEWRLKGHAREPFYRWLSGWGMSLKRPSDLGHDDTGYILPELTIHPTFIPTDYTPPGQLFATSLKGIVDRSVVRRDTVDERVRAAADLILAEADQPWIAWVGRNDEGQRLAKLLPDSVLVEGSQKPEDKAERLDRFRRGETRVLITKASITGWGLNLQMCARMAFVGLSDSYESYYQSIRRCWRFGQTRPVHAYVVLTDLEDVIFSNVLRKQREAEQMTAALVRHVLDYQRAEIEQTARVTDAEHLQPIRLPQWLQGAA